MTKKLFTVRDVDEEVTIKFRSRAVQERMKMGDAIIEAMNLWIKDKEYGQKPSFRRFLKLRRSKREIN